MQRLSSKILIATRLVGSFDILDQPNRLGQHDWNQMIQNLSSSPSLLIWHSLRYWGICRSQLVVHSEYSCIVTGKPEALLTTVALNLIFWLQICLLYSMQLCPDNSFRLAIFSTLIKSLIAYFASISFNLALFFI